MRILVAGRNAKVLATTAGAFANDLKIETATTKADSIAQMERTGFDLIVACETLGDDGTRSVEPRRRQHAQHPADICRPTFDPEPERRARALRPVPNASLPDQFRKLWAALGLARSCCAERKQEPEAEQEPVVLQVRGPAPGVRAPRAASAGVTGQRAPSAGKTVAPAGAAGNGRTAVSGSGAAARGAAVL